MWLRKACILLLITPLVFWTCKNESQKAPEEDQQITWDFEKWDTDEDSTLSMQEFKDGYIHSGYFKYWDANDDNFIAEDELKKAWKTFYMDLDNDGVFEAWDVNADGTLSKDEYIDGAYTIYDSDSDGTIESAEFLEFKKKDDK